MHDLEGNEVKGKYAEDLAERFIAFADKVKALKVLLDLCANADKTYNVDKNLYLMQHICRALSSCQRFCEMLYIAGPPKTGKDVIATMLQELFGDLSCDGWACGTVPKDHFCKGGVKQVKGSNTSIEASMAPSRIVIIPEVPDSVIDMDNLKDRIEQAGAKVASMAKYKAPQADRPGYLIVMISNHGPNCGSPPPQGSHRRLCHSWVFPLTVFA